MLKVETHTQTRASDRVDLSVEGIGNLDRTFSGMGWVYDFFALVCMCAKRMCVSLCVCDVYVRVCLFCLPLYYSLVSAEALE